MEYDQCRTHGCHVSWGEQVQSRFGTSTGLPSRSPSRYHGCHPFRVTHFPHQRLNSVWSPSPPTSLISLLAKCGAWIKCSNRRLNFKARDSKIGIRRKSPTGRTCFGRYVNWTSNARNTVVVHRTVRLQIRTHTTVALVR